MWKTYFFDCVDSTNDTAKSYPPLSVIIAKNQTKGRGRCQRRWIEAQGNLYMSVVLKDYALQAPFLAFVAGVSVAEALQDFKVRLKWPNDVLLNGQKVAGILLENQEDKLIMGIGVNVAQKPQSDDLIYPVASLENKISAPQVAQLILKSLTKWLDIFDKEGFEPVRLKWITLAEGLNRHICVKLPQKEIQGRFVNITSTGAILLETQDNSTCQISAGDVCLL